MLSHYLANHQFAMERRRVLLLILGVGDFSLMTYVEREAPEPRWRIVGVVVGSGAVIAPAGRLPRLRLGVRP